MYRPQNHFGRFVLGMSLWSTLCVHGFAHYLLRPSHWDLELSTDARIMDAPVVAAADSVDPSMSIEVTLESEDALILPEEDRFITRIQAQECPVYFSLRLLSESFVSTPNDDDYQWVMDIVRGTHDGAGAAFDNGGGPGQGRVTGRGPHAVAQLRLGLWANVTVRAAWATHYGAVTLTRPHTLIVSRDERVPVATPRQRNGIGRTRIITLLLSLLVVMMLVRRFRHRILSPTIPVDGISKRRS